METISHRYDFPRHVKYIVAFCPVDHFFITDVAYSVVFSLYVLLNVVFALLKRLPYASGININKTVLFGNVIRHTVVVRRCHDMVDFLYQERQTTSRAKSWYRVYVLPQIVLLQLMRLASGRTRSTTKQCWRCNGLASCAESVEREFRKF